MIEKIKSKIKPIIESLGLKLYDTETGREFDDVIFRVFITKEGGVSLDECVEVTRQISPVLDVYEPVEGEYRLEVSSPGIERNLKTLEHYEGSIGELITVTLKDKTKIQGKLVSANADDFTLEVKGEEETYSYSHVSKARTYFQW